MLVLLGCTPRVAPALCCLKVRPFNPSGAEQDYCLLVMDGKGLCATSAMFRWGNKAQYHDISGLYDANDLLIPFHTSLLVIEPKAGYSFKDQGGINFLVSLFIFVILYIRNSIGYGRKVKALSLPKEI